MHEMLVGLFFTRALMRCPTAKRRRVPAVCWSTYTAVDILSMLNAAGAANAVVVVLWRGRLRYQLKCGIRSFSYLIAYTEPVREYYVSGFISMLFGLFLTWSFSRGPPVKA